VYTSRQAKTILNITSGVSVTSSEADLNRSSPSNKPIDNNCADYENLFGVVRSELAGTLRIYQGIFANGSVRWVVRDEIAVSASAYSSGAFTALGTKITPIRVVGNAVKATFQVTSGGPNSNFELLLMAQ
jgi:hypothetical protein